MVKLTQLTGKKQKNNLTWLFKKKKYLLMFKTL